MNALESATELLQHLRQGDCSALDLLQVYFDRIDKYNPELNAIVWQDRESAIKTASAITGPPTEEQPLLGLPLTVKDAYDVGGAPTTWGIPELKDNIAATDSVAVERLKAAGAIVFGKTNIPLGLMDYQSYNDIYGTTNNPWNKEHTPGGSSGGSAAALAAGLTSFEMGSDIAGSIRAPAHFCGVYGHKPTYSLVPLTGHATPGVVMDPDLAVVGPMSRSASDLALILDVVGKAGSLSTGLEYNIKGLAKKNLSDLRVAVWANDPVMPVTSDVEFHVHKVADVLRDAGAYVNDDARPAFDSAAAFDIYQHLLWSFVSSAIPQEMFDAMKARTQAGENIDDYMAEIEKMHTIDHRTWVHFNNERAKMRWAWHEFFQDYDIVLAPQTPTTALKHDHSPNTYARKINIDGKDYPYFHQFFWSGLFGASLLPSTVIPTGCGEDGLPIGVQLVGNAWHDYLTIGVAQSLEDAGFKFQVPPGYEDE